MKNYMLIAIAFVIAIFVAFSWSGKYDGAEGFRSPDPTPQDETHISENNELSSGSQSALEGNGEQSLEGLNSQTASPSAITGAVDGELVADRGNVRVRLCASCEGGFEIDDPYSSLSLSELESLSESDATAAFQLAIRYYRANEENEEIVSIQTIEQAAMHAIALASADDSGWYYAGTLEHLDLYNRTNWIDVSDANLLRAFKWLEAGTRFEFTQVEDVEHAREEIERRGLDFAAAVVEADRHAERLSDMRMKLSGELLPHRGEG